MRTVPFTVLRALIAGVGALFAAIPVQAATCPQGLQRFEQTDIAFCWPTSDPTAPIFDRMSEGHAGGTAQWIDGKQVYLGDLTDSVEKERVIQARFAIVNKSLPLASKGMPFERDAQIREAAEAAGPDSSGFSLTFEQKKHGAQAFDFKRTAPDAFIASKSFPSTGEPEDVKHWVVMRKDGRLDYVMSCATIVEDVLGRFYRCDTYFDLLDNMGMAQLDIYGDLAAARPAFEQLRHQIRSYVIEPTLPSE